MRAKKQDLLNSLACEVSFSAASPHGCLLLPAFALQHALPIPTRGGCVIITSPTNVSCNCCSQYGAKHICQSAMNSMHDVVQMDELTASNSRLVEDSIEVDNDVTHLSAHLSATRTRILHTTTLSEQLMQELQMLQRVSCLQP